MKKILLTGGLLCFLLFPAQSVGINTANPVSSAMLDIKTNGDHKTVILPQVNLTSRNDVVSINGGNPEESLIIYNTNPAITGGKGIYYWDAEDAEWKFLVSQANINVFRNLTRYYTASSQTGMNVFTGGSSTLPGTVSPYTLNSGTTGWTMLKNSANTGNLTVPVKVDQPVNFVEVNLTGTWIVRDDSSLNHSIEFVYGIFVNGLLKYAKVDTKTFSNICGYSNFYIDSVIPNLPVGDHNVTYGVIVRRIRTDNDSNSYPNNANFTIGLGGGSAASGCNNINAFESETRATVYLNQTL